ncbi:hypothetical protein B0F90DRAFT_1824036 [Multifurca ochricompacta]|uniref:Hydrophobin n=1 Tax=Multifurca ochricompacta TaxID=376703 RepID=A0AAD4QJ68_9AGAM|nr:hypothetical protein B0F90DRAFT_1824036 [Multifurca ochricompacta]
MFYKPLISLVAALAATSTTVASAIPERRDSLAPIPASQCNTGTLSCCDTLTTLNDPLASSPSRLRDIALDPSSGVGLSCTAISGLPGAQLCEKFLVCCENDSQGGLIYAGCSPIIINL